MTGQVEYEEGETQGSYLGRLVDATGLSINKAAERAGVSREQLSRLVNDTANLTQDMAERLAPTLGVTPEKLVLPPEVEVESRRGLETRLRLVEGQATWLRRKLLQVLTEMNLEADDADLAAAEAAARSQPSPPRRKKGGL